MLSSRTRTPSKFLSYNTNNPNNGTTFIRKSKEVKLPELKLSDKMISSNTSMRIPGKKFYQYINKPSDCQNF